MLAQVIYPDKIEPNGLDDFLENGWFRMGQSIFTTNFLTFKNNFYSAIWLRIVLSNYCDSESQKKILKQNSSFNITIANAEITEEKEDLFTKYKNGINFEASESLHYLLYGNSNSDSIYYTKEICIYDGNKLIGVGYFDIGLDSAQGITCFYNPSYKKFSIGKYLMLLKISYCKQLGLKYFYPGYFAPGYKLFDYKLMLGKNCTQYLNLSKNKWINTAKFSDENVPLLLMRYKLFELQNKLFEYNIEDRLKNYRYFDASLIENIFAQQLLDFPTFLLIFDIDENNMIPIVVYNVSNEKYQILQCRSIWQSELTNSIVEIYSDNLLQVAEVLFESKTTSEILEFIGY
jgi:arginine-tRNA-protein transferase